MVDAMSCGVATSGRSIMRIRACVVLLALLVVLSGCELSPSFSAKRWASQRQALERQIPLHEAISPAELVEALKADVATPKGWSSASQRNGHLYTHYQWKSPSKATAFGVAYLRLPLPVSVQTIIWFAKNEYAKKGDDGELLDVWTDAIGRRWLEAQNTKYHVQAYVVTEGREAWVVYYG